MHPALNNSVALRAAARAKLYELCDPKFGGLLLRVQPSGVKTWYLEFERGKRIRLGRLTSMGYGEAVEASKSALGPYWAGVDPRIERQKRKQVSTFGEFIDEHYADWARVHQKTTEANLKRLKVAFKKFLKMPMATISPLDIERWRAQLKTREDRMRSERDTANQWRRERGRELLPSLRAVPFTDHLMPMVLLSLNTGMRRGELFDLKWSHVNFDRRIVTVSAETAKSRKTRHIPLNAEAYETLKSWRSQCDLGNSRVFESEDGARFDNVNSSWKKLLTDAKIVDFRWHDMRHHFASRLAMGAVDLNTIRELLGHSDYGMTLRYAHLAPEHRREAVEVLDRPRPHLKIVAAN